jgi:hypothetical protein
MRTSTVEVKAIEVNDSKGTYRVRLSVNGGRDIVLVPGMSFEMITDLPVEEIIEEGVTMIHVATNPYGHDASEPHEGRVKFFRDGLGQLWVKFTVADEQSDTVVDHVIPANLVVGVEYRKPRS